MAGTSKGIARAPYEVTAYARVCKCTQASNLLGTASTMDRAIKMAEGYWSVYLAFFGGQSVVFHWQVVDRRDGAVVWRDGRQLRTEEEQGGIEQAQPASGGDWPF